MQAVSIADFEHRTGRHIDRLLICRGQKASSSPWHGAVQFPPPGFNYEIFTIREGTWAEGALVNLTGVFLIYGGPTSSEK